MRKILLLLFCLISINAHCRVKYGSQKAKSITGEEIKVRIYDHLGEEMYSVRKDFYDRKLALMDSSNNLLTNFDFHEIYHMSDGLFRVEKYDPLNRNRSISDFLDRTGRAIGNFQYDFDYSFKDGLIIVSKRYKDKDVEDRKNNDRQNMMDVNGKLFFDRFYHDVDKFKNGLAKITIYNDGNYLSGYVDRQGKIIMPTIYDFNHINPFDGDFAKVRLNREDVLINRDNEVVSTDIRTLNKCNDKIWLNDGYLYKRYYIDAKTGKPISKRYNYLECPREDGIPSLVYNTKKWKPFWGLVNTEGKEILPPVYKSMTDFNQFRLCIVGKDKKNAVVNEFGEIISDWYSEVYTFSYNGMTAVEEKGKHGYVDTTGKLVIPIQFDSKYSFEFYKNLVRVKLNGKYAFITTKGEAPAGYFDKIKFISNDMAPVQQNKLWGYIDTTGHISIKPQYKDVESFNEESAPVLIGKKWGFINKKNEIILAPKYKKAYSFSEKLAPVKLDNNKWGYIDTSGIIVIQAKYQEAGIFREGLAPVKIADKWGFINKRGELIIPATFSKIMRFSEGFAGIKQNNLWGFINKNGKVVVEPKYRKVENFRNGKARVMFKRNSWTTIYESHFD